MSQAAPPRRRVRQERDARANAIIESASRLFAARGFRRTSISAVADDVGLTDAGVLHHFPNKKALLAAVLRHSTEQQAGAFRELLAPGGLEALRAMAAWGEVMEQGLQYTGLEITLSAEALEPGTTLHEFFERRYAVLRRWLIEAVERGIDAGEIRADVDAEREVTALVAFLDGIRLQWYFGAIDSLGTVVRDHVEALADRLVSSDGSGDSGMSASVRSDSGE